LNLLLVTPIALWAITDDVKLSQKARELILSPRNTIWVSAVNIWEIAIKHSLGRETMPISGKQAIQYFSEAGYRYLSIEPEHAAAVEDLPLLHQDPFDRLLTTQALIEPMRLITHDTKVAQYSDTIILV
jgi:PIN domain nuclease of toxin-antitoxin system